MTFTSYSVRVLLKKKKGDKFAYWKVPCSRLRRVTHRRLILSFFTFSVRRMTREYCIGHLIYGSLALIVKENDGSIKSYVVAARNKTTIKINNH